MQKDVSGKPGAVDGTAAVGTDRAVRRRILSKSPPPSVPQVEAMAAEHFELGCLPPEGSPDPRCLLETALQRIAILEGERSR